MITQTKSQSFEVAIVDGINRFVREVLLENGFIHADKADDIASEEILNQKYQIARTLAAQWAKMPMRDDPV